MHSQIFGEYEQCTQKNFPWFKTELTVNRIYLEEKQKFKHN